ncbi:uncharacterized protein LOC130614710 [Hydractinia symbiolongicarpus]|uniref:uncharacterized protein LOC130614710 n=1 Tax=Hydractinia symbiolongicarpus TaxID=13093 RepID=UPI002549EDEA|nr:uncharacterized protein LOC130614710 [Hydractinia symbiolongicarpus]
MAVKLSERAYKKWLQKRKQTLIAFTLQNVLIGTEFSLTFLTLWLYLKEMVKPDYPKVYYSAISSSYLLISMSSSLVIGRLSDRYRNVRRTAIVLNILAAFGNVIYALPFSPFLLLFGRLLSGFGGPLRSVIIGELARVYSNEELLSIYSVMGMAYSIGFVFGPGINFAFKSVNVEIGAWNITYLNLPSLFLAVLFIIQIMLTLYFVHDLSKEYDLKEEDGLSIKRSNAAQCDSQVTISYFETEDSPLITKRCNNMPSTINVLKQLFSKLPTTLLLCSAFFENYFVVSFDIWLPLLVVDVLKWSIVELNLIVLLTGVSCIASCIILIFKTPVDKTIYLLAIFSTISIIFSESTFMVLSYISNCLPLSITLWIIFGISYCFLIVTEEIFLVGCLAKMVSSHIQTYVDSIRLTMYRLGGLAALATSALIFDYILIVGTVHVVLVVIGITLLIYERHALRYPKIIIY